jgi:hypothetical protein
MRICITWDISNTPNIWINLEWRLKHLNMLPEITTYTKLEGDPRYRLGNNIFQADPSNNTLYVFDILTIW